MPLPTQNPGARRRTCHSGPVRRGPCARWVLRRSLLACRLLAALVCTSPIAFAQSLPDSSRATDSLWTVTLPETVVTATRTPSLRRDVPVPTRILSAETIERQGALRLSDFLIEQTGLTLVQDHGTGLQIQGFDPAYSLVLIDGEPVIGREAGTLDLGRLPVSNIARIEIVEGPSSSLYGSEALAGVVNIVTKTPQEPIRLTLGGRFESHDTKALDAAAELSRSNAGVRVQYTELTTAGYDLSPGVSGLTAPGYTDRAVSIRSTYRPRGNLRVDVTARHSFQTQDNAVGFDQANTELEFNETARRIEWSVSPRMRHPRHTSAS